MKNCPICGKKSVLFHTKYVCPEQDEIYPSHVFEIWGANDKYRTECWEYKGYHVGTRACPLPSMPKASVYHIDDINCSNVIKEWDDLPTDEEIKDFIDGLAN